ncbi:hypothetical protein Tco_0768293 [Tanacetum coccineum]
MEVIKAVRIEDAFEKAMCAIDGAGFDWSDMAEDEIQANMALMAFTDSENSQQPEVKDRQRFGEEKFFNPAILIFGGRRSLKARENSAAPYEDWVSDDEEEVELSLMECSGTMSGNIANLLDFKDFDVWMLLLVAEQMEEELLAKVAIGYIEESIVMAEEAWVYKEFLVLSTSSQQDQDCIVMPIWKDASYFDDASLKSVDDAQIQDQDGTHDDCSLQNNGTADQQVNTASPKVNTGSREVSTAVPESSVQTKKIMKVSKALSDPAWVEAMQEELLQFKLQNVWVLVDLPKGYRAIVQMGLQKQERMTGDSHQNNARLLPKDILMMKGIDYNEVFAPSG